jgi:hypothetical protein
MTDVILTFSNNDAKRIEHYLQEKYKVHKNKKLQALCRIAVLKAVAEQASEEANWNPTYYLEHLKKVGK